MSNAWRAKLAAWGVLDGRATAAMRPLVEHLGDWEAALLAKGNDLRNVRQVKVRAKRVLDGCGFVYWGDLAPSAVERYLAELRTDTEKRPGISRQTSNWHLGAVKQFCRWCVADGRAVESPIAHLKALNVRTDRRHDRRALTASEFQRLLNAAHGGHERCEMPGPERALLYRLAASTGLRRGELESLRRSSFDLNADEPTVTVEAGYSKRRRRDTLPLRAELVETLRAHLVRKAPARPGLQTAVLGQDLACLMEVP